MTGKQGFQRFRPKLVSLAVASCFVTSSVLANPTNPVVKHGAANFTNPAANVLHVTTATPQTIINWGSFSISANELTKFLQPSAASAVLNRVVGGDPSAILGALQSNGRVLLVNPSGIIFGAGAQIDVAGLVATSLNLSNADFLANRMKFAEVPGAGSIVNNGNITTPQGGSVYLVGPAVTNNGIIATPKGEVVLAAGNSVELVNPGTPNLRVEISAAENEARNIGQIISESGRVGIYAGLINNSGTVRANSAVAQGGKILLQATKKIDLESTSILDASGAGGGRIDVLAKNGGTVNVAGKLNASAPTSGDGGFVETSADVVNVASGTAVNTSAARGKTGTWLIDPIDYWIFNDGGNISGVDLGNNLGTTNVTIDTAGYGGDPGNITVDDPVSWNSNKSLTLVANSDIFVNQKIENKSTGGINLYAGWDGISPSSAPVVVPDTSAYAGDIMVAAPISTLGDVKLIAGGHAHQICCSYGGSITANGLRIDSLGTSANFAVYANSVNTLSGQSVQGFQFANSKTFSVGTTGGLSGITVNSPSSSAFVDLSFSGTTGATNLNVNSNITAIAGGSFSNASVQLTGNSAYGGNVNISNAKLTATGDGGEGGFIGATAFTGGSVNIANSTLEANSTGTIVCCSPGSNINISGNTVSITSSTLEAVGPSGGASYGGGSGFVSVNGNSGVTITGSTLRGQGGNGASGGQGNVSVNSGTGTLTIQGGSLIEALGGIASSGQGGWANININSNSPQTINLNNSTVRAKAGTGSTSGESFVGIFDGSGSINITNGSNIQADGAEGQIRVAAVGDVTITGSSFTAKGNGSFGDSFVDVEASKVSVSNSSFTVNHVTNAPDEPGSSEASVYMYASGSGGLSISGSTIGISATGTAPGMAFAELGSGEASGNVAISNSTISASGLFGGVLVQSSSGNVAVTNSTITAAGKPGEDGGPGIVFIAAGGTINTSGSTVTATGCKSGECGSPPVILVEEGPPPPESEFATMVLLNATGDITLGSVVSSDFATVTSQSGRIIDGNSTGANVTAPFVDLIAATGIGTISDPLETATTNLIVDTLNGDVGIANQGNLILANLFNGGAGTSVVGTTGTMVFANPVDVSGNLSLLANNGMVVEQNIFASGDLRLDSGIGDMGFTGVTVSGNNVTLLGNNIFVGFDTNTAPTFVGASNLMTVTTLGNLNVLGGASPTASAELHGGVDVNLTVGQLAGFVNVVTGSTGASAQISAGSPDTINLHFPTLGTGGYFVNGSENVITSGNTGFFVNGLPAVLNENFFVTYGVTELPPDVQLAINQTIASTNQQSQLGTDVGNETGGTGELQEDKEKKQLPVCSR